MTATILAAAAVLVACSDRLHQHRTRRRLRSDGLVGTTTGPAALAAPPRVDAALRRAGVTDPDATFSTWLVGLGAAAAFAVVVPSARVLLAVGLVGPPALLALAGDRLGRRRSRQLPDALDATAAGLRGGASLPEAIAGATAVGAPLGDELRSLTDAVAAGRPLDRALTDWATGAEDTATGLAAAALTVAARVGGPGARAIDGAAASLRDRLDADAEAAALATQGRASALVLTLAPVGFAVLLTGLDPRAGRFLLATPAGWACIASGLALDALGAWWMTRLVRRAR